MCFHMRCPELDTHVRSAYKDKGKVHKMLAYLEALLSCEKLRF
jgi:hypothetical protein